MWTGTPDNLHPQNAHLETAGEKEAWDLIAAGSQWDPGSYFRFKNPHTKFMPKLCHVISGQVDAWVVK